MVGEESSIDDIVRAFVLSLFLDKPITDKTIDDISSNDQFIQNMIKFAHRFDENTSLMNSDIVMPSMNFDFFGEVKKNLAMLKKSYDDFYHSSLIYNDQITRFGNDLVIYDYDEDDNVHTCIDIFGNHWSIYGLYDESETIYSIKKL